MSDYSNDQFEGSQDGANNNGGAAGDSNATYKLKLSIDIREAKNFQVAANVFVQFSVKLANGQFH